MGKWHQHDWWGWRQRYHGGKARIYTKFVVGDFLGILVAGGGGKACADEPRGCCMPDGELETADEYARERRWIERRADSVCSTAAAPPSTRLCAKEGEEDGGFVRRKGERCVSRDAPRATQQHALRL